MELIYVIYDIDVLNDIKPDDDIRRINNNLDEIPYYTKLTRPLF